MEEQTKGMIIHPQVFAAAGPRDRKTPAFLSRKQVKCSRCGRMEYGNVEQERLVMCSLCTMGLSMGKQEKTDPGVQQEAQPSRSRAPRRSRPARICERCGESFRGRSNRQRFCEKCQKWATKDTDRVRKQRSRKNHSVVTV